MTTLRTTAWTAAALSTLVLVPGTMSAQTDVEMLGRALGGARPPAGYYEVLARHPNAFRFSANNGWRLRARRVTERRRALRAQWTLDVQRGQLAAVSAAAQAVVAGDVYLPAFLILYADTDSASLVGTMPRATMQSRLYGTAPAPPYTVHTYYLEVSGDSLRVNGTVFEWTRVLENGTYYEGSSNGLGFDGNVAQLIEEMVAAHDDTVDYGQFDNDGPDGVPNSGDDDGYVDAVVLLHPEVDGACLVVYPPSASNIWAHRWVYSGWTGSPLVTGDDAWGGGKIRVDDYIIQGGQGGDGGCTPDEPQAPGVITHETGHLLDLPDLYNTGGGPSEAIGHWGLMGSGGWNKANRPAHLMAWSRAQLGWVTEVLIDRDTTLQIEPVENSDTAFAIPIPGSNEYFLLENRQRIGSDSMLHQRGLLVWHIDSALARSRSNSNTVNAFPPEAVRLVQADGMGHLQAGSNRGDTGDPFPGVTGKTLFRWDTNPASRRNNGALTEVSIDSIEQLDATAPWGAVRVVISNTAPALVMTPAAPPAGLMGTAYQYAFEASGGIGIYDWLLVGGALPGGMVLGSDGMLTGIPAETGTFVVAVQVTSASQAQQQAVQLEIAAPVLAAAAVVNEVLGVSQTLTADERRYLDLLGNRNAGYDVGDFLAWVESGDAPLTARALAEGLATLRGRE
jgi:M6 family metalloprotease-like protein